MKFRELWHNYPACIEGADVEVTGITYDSRQVQPGDVFVAIHGYDTDGHQFIASAEGKGAAAIVAERDVETSLPLCVVEDGRRALSHAASVLYGHPSEKLKIVGVTGTKGKTTVTTLLYNAATEAGMKAGRIGTIGVAYGDVHYPLTHTTPESADLHRILREMVDVGVELVLMEVSSLALSLERVADIGFDIGIFTNLTPDHIGGNEHASMAEYARAKAMLFERAKVSILSADDPYGREMDRFAKGKVATYGMDADVKPEDLKEARRVGEETTFRVGGAQYALPSVGRFNVENALAVIAAAQALGLDETAVAKSLEEFRVPGRMEILPSPEGTTILLDYAHNGASIESLIAAVRPGAERILLLVGSVGGRTRSRRREIMEAAKDADLVILTSDNPDYEDPGEIIDEMAQYATMPVLKEPDRTRAVARAVEMMQKGDLLILAGKGHEEGQLIRGVLEPYSDREAVETALRRLSCRYE